MFDIVVIAWYYFNHDDTTNCITSSKGMKNKGGGSKPDWAFQGAAWDRLMTHWTKKWRGGARNGRRRQSFVLLRLFMIRVGIEVTSVTTTFESDRFPKEISQRNLWSPNPCMAREAVGGHRRHYR